MEAMHSSCFSFFGFGKKSNNTSNQSSSSISKHKTLAMGEVDTEYTISSINTFGDEELKNFLFSLGCYEGQKVTIISNFEKNFVISIKDARYSIDIDLANSILI